MKNFNFLALFLFVGIVLSSCSKEEDKAVTPAPAPNAPAVGKATIKLDHMWGNTTVARLNNSTPFVSANGDSITLTTFNYYLTNVKLIKADDSEWSMPNSYYLVRLTATSHEVELEIPNVPVGEYKGIKYMIGVDSTRVVNADLSLPSLQPINGMFWSWNSGFIHVKCEGTSPQVPASRPNRDFAFHVGGYRDPNNALQNMSHDFGSSRLRVQANANPEMHMKVFIDRFFSGPGRQVQLSTFTAPNHSVGTNAINLSLNYREMFTYDHMHN